LKPSYIHFDDVSIRLITLLPLLSKSKFKMILNVHDPVPHSGEKNFKNIGARMLFYKRADKFITFSKYSEKLFKETFKCYAQLCTSIKLKPYKFYSQFDKNINENKNYISFLGRFSLYKGIDIFIKVIDQLQKVCPDQNFLIAGNPTNGFNYDLKSDPKLPKNTTVIQRHLSAKEMCNLIQDSVLIICPYRDATQSGVIMTAYALNTPVIVTDVGGLPEYVIEGKTGYISICDPISIVNTTLDIISEERKGLNTKLEISEIANKYFLNSKEKLLSIYN
jgi:glycosyltransferase involved in cell wall biosynthesis